MIALLVIVGAIALFSSRLRWLALVLLAFCWCLGNFQVRLADRLDPALAGRELSVSGVISSIPQANRDYIRFRFAPDSAGSQAGLPQGLPQGLPGTLLVSWYQDWPDLSVGQRWKLDLKLKPPWGSVNFQGSDKEKWLFAEGIGGLATVRAGALQAGSPRRDYPVQSIREAVLEQVDAHVSNGRQRGIIQALATADRSGISPGDRQLLQLTGTSHLLAISGLHIGLAAAGGVWFSRLLFGLLPLMGLGGVPFFLSIIVGMLAAMAYAALAGFGIPTVRAIVMLLVVMTALLFARSIHPFRAWSIALAAVLLVNPFAPLSAGFWFSFLAVAALMFLSIPRNGKFPIWKSLLMAQGAVMLVLLPVSAAWFQSFSLVGFAANLVAIPWVSFLVVPFVLAGVATLTVSGSLAAGLWSFAGGASDLLMVFLEFLARLQGSMTTLSSPSGLQLALALMGGFLLLLPRGIPMRWGGLFLLVPLILPPGDGVEPGAIRVDVLDAGQGTAVIVSTAGHTLLYDTGPGDGRHFDRVNSIIAPALNQLARRAPDRVVISHGDLDHAGGLRSVRERYPDAVYYANLPEQSGHMNRCVVPLEWRWHDVGFSVLHPTSALPYLGNDSSCVIEVRTKSSSLLLSGDISAAVEARLIAAGIESQQLLLVPHHGSKTSSSNDFVRQIRPRIAIATASLGNRFDFPRQEVQQRYLANGAWFWSTGDCGAIRLILEPDGALTAISARNSRNRIWRWPAAKDCP